MIVMENLRRLMENAEMLADVKAYDAAKIRLEDGEDELIPLEIIDAGWEEKPRSGFGASTGSLLRSGLRRRRKYRAR